MHEAACHRGALAFRRRDMARRCQGVLFGALTRRVDSVPIAAARRDVANTPQCAPSGCPANRVCRG